MINSVIIVLITADERNDVFLPISGFICQTFLDDTTKFRQMAAEVPMLTFELSKEDAQGFFCKHHN